MDKRELQDILSKPYEADKWISVLKNVFGVRNVLQKPLPISLPSNKPKLLLSWEVSIPLTTGLSVYIW